MKGFSIVGILLRLKGLADSAVILVAEGVRIALSYKNVNSSVSALKSAVIVS